MPLFLAPNRNRLTLHLIRRSTIEGFTLIELIIVVFIVGILSAMAVPSFLSINNKSKLNNAVTTVQGALQEAQITAMRQSKACTVTLDTTNKQVTGACLVTGTRTLPTGVAMQTNLVGNTIKFSFKGTTTNSGTIAIYLSDSTTSDKKCLAISNGIGIMRKGKYTGGVSTSSAISSVACTTTQ